MMTPNADRPHIPGYGIAAADEGGGLLPWSWAEERLARSHNYWVAVTRLGGGPHLTPVWGVWHDGAFWFSTGGSVKVRALAADPRCVVSTESGEEAVIIEGEASRGADRAVQRVVIGAYNEKYRWDFDADKEELYVVRPRVVFGFVDHPGEFARTATRWKF
jgi:hypothetical protein